MITLNFIFIFIILVIKISLYGPLLFLLHFGSENVADPKPCFIAPERVKVNLRVDCLFRLGKKK